MPRENMVTEEPCQWQIAEQYLREPLAMKFSRYVDLLEINDTVPCYHIPIYLPPVMEWEQVGSADSHSGTGKKRN